LMKILLIEDELKTQQYLKQGLEENGYQVDSASDGVTGLQLAAAGAYHLIISDVIMPGQTGLELTRQLRNKAVETPVLLLTALGTTDDIVRGFDVGADDYLAKPFEFRELLARIKSLTRRHQKSQQEILQFADVVMNLTDRTVKRGNKNIDLTAKEFALLEYFLRNPGKVIARSELARNVWNIDFDTGTNMVEVYVNYLRKKVDRNFSKKIIHTQFGMGYILKEG